jgi:hypothetical protein
VIVTLTPCFAYAYLENGERDGGQWPLVGQLADRKDVHAPVGRVLKDLENIESISRRSLRN